MSSVHDFFFTGPEVAQAISYGIYDLAADTGWVNVGVEHDTSAFAVASIRRWWQARGLVDYPEATRLLITADAGGSNSYRYRAWKAELATFAAETGLAITVCHLPPATSKWNKIEHRLFSHITLNWRGRPLTSHEVVVNTIAATHTRTGLRVEAELDTGSYPTGTTVSKQRMDTLPLQPHATFGRWNYTLHPAQPQLTEPGVPEDSASARSAALEMLTDPRLTGLARAELGTLASELGPAQAARAQQRYSEQRGGRRRKATGNLRARPLLDEHARVLITVLHIRRACTLDVLAELLEVSRSSVGNAVRATRPLLDQDRRYSPTPAPRRFQTTADLLVFLNPRRASTTRSFDSLQLRLGANVEDSCIGRLHRRRSRCTVCVHNDDI